MPVGRMVLARIVKIDEKNGQKRFNGSLRKSLAVYGTSTLQRSELSEGT